MPKRSNPFQRLVKAIYAQLASENVEVRESVLVPEENQGTEREVDILIEQEIADSKIRMAVETCDEARPATVTWIDELVGKYARLPIDKVIAVSRSGFSSAARKKAKAHRFETKTLEEALEADWPAELIKIGVAKVSFTVRWDEVGLIADPPLGIAPPLESSISNEDGKDLVDLRTLLDECFRVTVVPAVRAEVWTKLKVLADLRKKALAELTVTPRQSIFVAGPEGQRHQIRHLTFLTITTFSFEKLPVGHQTFGRAVISTTTVDFGDSKGPLRFSFVQATGKKGARVLIENPGKQPSRKRRPRKRPRTETRRPK